MKTETGPFWCYNISLTENYTVLSLFEKFELWLILIWGHIGLSPEKYRLLLSPL